MITIKIRREKYFTGKGDTQSNDPLGGIYSPHPFEARNKYRVEEGPIPEVRQFKNGDTCYIWEGIEWMGYYAWRAKVPSLPEAEAKKVWEKYMRHNAAFTNLGGIDECRSWVLNRYPTKKPMKYNGVDCPNENSYRWTGDPDVTDGEGIVWTPVWNLDYDWLKANLTKDNARSFALSLPRWLLHAAKTIHPDGHVTGWDYGFSVPPMTSKAGERTAIVGGFRCKRNYMRSSRLDAAVTV